MTSDQRKKLSEIKQFKQLIAYLRDEMGWPINSESEFDELTYEYTTTELGIDDKSAAQIQEIKRLRPLSAKQPWGVFFVKFEPKKLPVVALRRILGQVALKKRASANPADRTMWAQEDLLFISNYGEGDDRQITLAHFSVPTGGHTLPSLKVLGWDSKDTVLHLEAVARELTEQLSWPDDESDVDAWRAKWRAAFTVGHQEVITTSKALSIRLAQLARDIRDRISTALTIETEDGPLTKLMKAFQESLIHDLTSDDFADMYAQTIAYGLLSSRIADPKKKSVDDLTAHMRLSPFLKELMETFLHVGGRHKNRGLDFDELGVGDVIDLLDQANMEAVVADFGDKNPQEDPVIHFYELFLKEYDAKKRMSRGVFYTPRPVVAYIVRSVNGMLRNEFGLPDGLADITTWGELAERDSKIIIPKGISPDQAFVQILDPATGTGTFLVEVIDTIFTTLREKWRAAGLSETEMGHLWNEYVPKHLLPRLYGYELMMAPYAIAHLKLSLKLHETGYRFAHEQRAQVFLTNSLDVAQDYEGQLAFTIPVIANEMKAVNEVKTKHRFTVVIGNPPYSNVSGNMSKDARKLVDDFRYVDNEKISERAPLVFERSIQDDYIKFFALARQQVLKSNNMGVIGMISNASFLESPYLRGMRNAFYKGFRHIQITDLGGDVKNPQDGSNVFEIRQPVAISIMSNSVSNSALTEYIQIFGTAQEKLDWLDKNFSTERAFLESTPRTPLYLFKPHTNNLEYAEFVSLEELFVERTTGVITSRDPLTVDRDQVALRKKISYFASENVSDEQVQSQIPTASNAQWDFSRARRLMRNSINDKLFGKFGYRPFDDAYIYYDDRVIANRRPLLVQSVWNRSNLCLVTVRNVRTENWAHAFITALSPSSQIVSSADASHVFPVNVFGEGLLDGDVPTSNFNARFTDQLTQNPLNVVYAILHSPEYRSQYQLELKRDIPRIPTRIPENLATNLEALGGRLIELHLLHFDLKVVMPISIWTEGDTAPAVGTPTYADGTIHLSNTSGSSMFAGVAPEVWNFHIGSYQVCAKWLKDRKGQTLSAAEVTHFHKIVYAISETIQIMNKIDEAINEHGGWPAAFMAKQDGELESR